MLPTVAALGSLQSGRVTVQSRWHPAYDATSTKGTSSARGFQRARHTTCPCLLTNHPVNEDVEASAAAYGVDVTVILDIIHVVEYVWKAAHVFHREGSPELECWAWTRVRSILEGKASKVAAAMRRAATVAGLSSDTRKPVDTCADYLLKYAPYLHYDRYLAAGYPIATGVIEGACRYLVRDRMELTGARWRLVGAEAVLKLRALRASRDFDAYWDFPRSARVPAEPRPAIR